MPSFSIIKSNAKVALKGFWPKAFAVGSLAIAVEMLTIIMLSFIGGVFQSAGNTVSFTAAAVFLILSILFMVIPFILGIIRWFWFSSLENQVPVSECFHYFSNTAEYVRAILFGFHFFVKAVVCALICFSPTIILLVITQPLIYETFGTTMPYWFSSFWMLENALFICGMVAFVFYIIRFFPAPVLLVNDDTLSTREALHLATVVSKSELGHTFGFLLSFIGWAVLSLFVIPLLYVTPYFLCSYVVFCRFLINQYNRNAEIRNNTFFPDYCAYM